MVAVLVIAHTPLATALREVATHVYPERGPQLLALDVDAQADPVKVEHEARARMQACGADDWLVLTDVFGATPCNAALRLTAPDPARPGLVRVVAGVNVPMIWRALCYADEPLESLVQRALAGAAQGVMPLAAPRPQAHQQPQPPGPCAPMPPDAKLDHPDPQ